jgi:hypothetical protein
MKPPKAVRGGYSNSLPLAAMPTIAHSPVAIFPGVTLVANETPPHRQGASGDGRHREMIVVARPSPRGIPKNPR